MSSFGESKANGLAENSPTEWIQLNQRQLSRVYPAGRRTDSSNYEPMPAWLAGSQIGNKFPTRGSVMGFQGHLSSI